VWNPDALGWLAAGLMVATFGCRDASAMRPLAVATNLAFIGYGIVASLPPVLTLHLVLLPINLWRWAEALRAKRPPLTWPRSSDSGASVAIRGSSPSATAG
jgi:hypothetical protein